MFRSFFKKFFFVSILGLGKIVYQKKKKDPHFSLKEISILKIDPNACFYDLFFFLIRNKHMY